MNSIVHQPHPSHKGFTLLETLVALVIAVPLMLLVHALLKASVGSVQRTETKAVTSNVTVGLNYFAEDLGRSSVSAYKIFPENSFQIVRTNTSTANEVEVEVRRDKVAILAQREINNSNTLAVLDYRKTYSQLILYWVIPDNNGTLIRQAFTPNNPEYLEPNNPIWQTAAADPTLFPNDPNNNTALADTTGDNTIVTKSLATDVLRFQVTDEGHQVIVRATNGETATSQLSSEKRAVDIDTVVAIPLVNTTSSP